MEKIFNNRRVYELVITTFSNHKKNYKAITASKSREDMVEALVKMFDYIDAFTIKENGINIYKKQ